MSHKHINAHTQVLLGGLWGRGERALAPLSGKHDLLTSASSEGLSGETSVCECVPTRSRSERLTGMRAQIDEARDTRSSAVVIATY